MKSLQNCWLVCVKFFSTKETGESLALFRIAFAFAILYYLYTLWSLDLVSIFWVDIKDGGIRNLYGTPLVRFLGGATSRVVFSLFWGSVTLAIMMALGLGGRIVILGLSVSYYGLIALNYDISGGFDLLYTNGLWILWLSSCTKTWSLDCVLLRRRWSTDQLISAWPRYLLLFQLLLTYFSTGIQKVSPNWSPSGYYTALYWALSDPSWYKIHPDFWAHRITFFLTQVGTAVTWHWEQCAPLLLLILYYRKTKEQSGFLRGVFNKYDLRKAWVFVGVCLHVGILFTMEVGPFSFVALAYYLNLLHPSEIRSFCSNLRSWLKQKRSQNQSE